MLDVIFVLAVLALMASTIVYVYFCDYLLRTDSTLETVHRDRGDSWVRAPQPDQAQSARHGGSA